MNSKELLIKYLNNNCSDKEFEALITWIKKNIRNKEGKTWSYDLWKMFEPELRDYDKKKYSALLDKIHHKINLNHEKKVESNIITFSKLRKWLSHAAAILFIPLLGVMFYLLSNSNPQMDQVIDLTVDSLEIIAPTGSRAVVQLSDGSEVHLNYSSKIKYPRNFTGNTRGIRLSGEGYFDVAHNPDKPFIVKTESLNIKALGTEFNVKAYPEDDIIATTLVEGKVLINKIVNGGNVQQIGSMVPGQHVTYNLDSENISTSKGNINKYIAWKEGKLVLDNTPIILVSQELGRKFNVDIEVADNIKYLTYTVTFDDDPLFLILDLMTEMTPVSYIRFPRKKMSDGTFSKQRIRIEKRK